MNIYKSNGQYIGFIEGNNIFLWNGEYVGWVDSQRFAWSRTGGFLGQIMEKMNNNYIIRNIYTIPPISRNPVINYPTPKNIPVPSPNIPSISLEIGQQDAF